MVISFSQASGHEVMPFDSTLSKYFSGSGKIIKKIKSLKGTITTDKVGSTLICKVKLKGVLNVVSSYTNIPFDTSIVIDEDMYFTNKSDQEADEIIFVKDSIDFDYYIYSIVLTSLPIDIHKKGEKLPSGDGYRVLKEEDLIKEKAKNSSNKNNPFTKLDGIDFDK